MLVTRTLTMTQAGDEIRRDMVSVVFDTLSNEVKSMLLNEEGTKGIVCVTQPYMNLNEAAVLRDQIDDILTEDTGLEGTESSKLTGGLPVSHSILMRAYIALKT